MTPHNDWTDRLRTRLRDAELTPPERGWARLEETLHTPAAAPRRRLGALLLPHRLPIAAALLVGTLLTGLYLRPTEEAVPPPVRPYIEPLVRSGGEVPTTEDQSAAPPKGQAYEALAAHRPVQQPIAQQTPAAEAAASKSDTAGPNEPTARNEPPTSGEGAAAAEARPSRAAASSVAQKPDMAKSVASKPAPPVRRAAPRRTSIALFGSGLPTLGIRHTPSASPGFILQDGGTSITYTTGNADLEASRRTDYAHSEFSHRRPWSVGLTLRKEFKYGLSLETGLVYTALKSTVTTRGRAYDQQLHLLGVPLRLNWAFVDRPHGALYLGAGGMLERCIRARLGSMRCSEEELQFSLGAVVGGEYRIGRTAALYAEPEWSCSLTDTELRTVRTDRPVTFTLRVGLRFTF